MRRPVRTGPARAAGLALASAALMTGVVFAANPSRYGVGGIALGALLMVGGMAAAVRLFRGGRGSEPRSSTSARTSRGPGEA